MNEIITTSQMNLPETLPDLSRFVLIGRDKLKAVRAEIHAIDKVGMARDVYQQKLEEAQEIAEVVTDAECRMGELLNGVPKATKGQGGNRYQKAPDREISSHDDFSKPKSQVIKESGLSQRQTEHFQFMANHPESVEKAKAKAREEGTVLSRNAVIEQIRADTHLSKTNRQAQKEFIESVKQEREDFKEQKAEGVVSFNDAIRDKENAEFLAQEMFRRCMKLGSQIDTLCIEVNEKEVDLSEVLKPLSEDERNRIRWQFDNWRQKLLMLEGELIE